MTMLRADLSECRFNFYKGMWETDPAHWVLSHNWIFIAMLWATSLERGVHEPGAHGRRIARAIKRRDAERRAALDADEWYAAEVARMAERAPA